MTRTKKSIIDPDYPTRTIPVNPELYKDFKIAAIKMDMLVTDLMFEILEEGMKRVIGEYKN